MLPSVNARDLTGAELLKQRQQYINGLSDMQKVYSHSELIHRALHISMYNIRNFEAERLTRLQQFAAIQYQDDAEAPFVNQYLNRALNLCESGLVQKFFGLGFKDLMELDCYTFTLIENRLDKLAKVQSKSAAAAMDDLE